MLLIDCYNVLHTPMPPMLAGLDEAGLCRALGRTSWARGGGSGGGSGGGASGGRASGGGVVVVADGKPKPLGVTDSPVDEVDLVYSGPSRTADAVIIEMIRDHSSPRRMTVVSSDRQIRAAARKRRCKVWTSEQFVTRLVEQLRNAVAEPGSSSKPLKPSGELSREEVEGWLDAFGVDEDLAEADTLPAPDIPPTADDLPPPRRVAGEGAGDEDDPFNIPGVWPPPGM